MNAGAYRSLVTIQMRQVMPNANLIDEEIWVEFCTNFAYVNKLSGTEFWAAAEVAAQNTVRFTMRWHEKLDRVTPGEFRILFKGRVFNITNVDNVQFKNETVKISATEVE